MAIYVGLRLTDRTDSRCTYRFFASDGTPYGSLVVDTTTGDIDLLTTENEATNEEAFLYARRAIEKALIRGELPDDLCFAA